MSQQMLHQPVIIINTQINKVYEKHLSIIFFQTKP